MVEKDVLVVGGGPAGLHLATLLSKAGFDALLLDDRYQIGHRKICTGIIGAEAFDALDLPRDSILNQIQSIDFVSQRGKTINYVHPTCLAYVVDRSAFDRSLAKRALASGAEIQVGTKVVGVEVSRQGVSVKTLPCTGSKEHQHFQGKILAIATGVNSRLNKLVGLGCHKEFLYAAQAHVPIEQLERTKCFIGRDVAPGGFAWMVPLNRGMARIGLMTDKDASGYFRTFLEKTAAQIGPHQSIQGSFKPIGQCYSGPSFADRVIAVGEAAGQVKSTTGGGIYYGLLGAEIGASVLQTALHNGQVEKDFLATYERRWKERLQEELTIGHRYRKIFSNLSDSQIETLFKLTGSRQILGLVKKTVRFDWHRNLLQATSQYLTV